MSLDPRSQRQKRNLNDIIQSSPLKEGFGNPVFRLVITWKGTRGNKEVFSAGKRERAFYRNQLNRFGFRGILQGTSKKCWWLMTINQVPQISTLTFANPFHSRWSPVQGFLWFESSVSLPHANSPIVRAGVELDLWPVAEQQRMTANKHRV